MSVSNEFCAKNTVDFKNITQYSRNVNTLAKLTLENSDSWRNLEAFMKPHRVQSGTSLVNVTAPGGSYCIEKGTDYETMFTMLSACAKEGLVLHFRELQIGGRPGDLEKEIGSGIMLDFDILTPEPKPCSQVLSIGRLVKYLWQVLREMIHLREDDRISIMVTTKPEPVFKATEAKFKDGLHVLIPSVQLTRVQKKMFIEQILQSKEVDTVFREAYNNQLGIKDVMDTQCASVPVFFLHNCKEASMVAHNVHSRYYVRYPHMETELMTPVELEQSNHSLIRDYSLVYQGVVVQKRFYKFTGVWAERAHSRSQAITPIEQERDESINTFNTYNSYVEDNMEYYRTLVMDVLDAKRAEDRGMWRDTVFAIANINDALRPGLKEIARQFSMRCESKYSTDAFEKLWKEACAGSGSGKLSYRSLIYWCKADNRVKFDEIRDTDIKQVIEKDVFHRENKLLNGQLYQYHFAYYMLHLFSQKFSFDTDSTGKISQWYEFVLENDSHVKGELYKWRPESRPENLMLYLSNKFPDIINTVIRKAEERMTMEKDEQLVEYIQGRMQQLMNSSRGLYRNDFKYGIVKECEPLFRRRGFMESMDKEPEVMGVGNGVLELKTHPHASVKLLTGYHEYRISMGTQVNYRPFDPKDESIQKMMKFLKSIFPQNERDAMHKLMYTFSTGLDGRPVDSEFWQLTGVGSNAKSSLMELLKTVFGKYGGKLSMSVLTEGRHNSASANEQLMVLKTARLAFYSETNKSEVLNTAIAKELTSQESITGRGIYEKQQTFRPNCLHVITTNHPMTIKTTDHGTWRRLKLYTMKMKFVQNPDPANPLEQKVDESVAKAMAMDDSLKEAMLSILVEYYKDLHENHGGSLMNIPSPTIEKETAKYRYEQDILSRFICDNMVYSEHSQLTMQDLCELYERWIEAQVGKGQVPDRKDTIGQILGSSLVKFISRTNTRIMFKGVRVLDLSLLDDQLSEGEEFLRVKLGMHVPTDGDDGDKYDESKYNPCKM
jgi:P4 family phage/plasmid primase-like protien